MLAVEPVWMLWKEMSAPKGNRLSIRRSSELLAWSRSAVSYISCEGDGILKGKRREGLFWKDRNSWLSFS
jgi:hypothetical protein